MSGVDVLVLVSIEGGGRMASGVFIVNSELFIKGRLGWAERCCVLG